MVEVDTVRSFFNEAELENFFVDKDDNLPKELKDRDLDDNENVCPLLFALERWPDGFPPTRFCFNELDDKDLVRA